MDKTTEGRSADRLVSYEELKKHSSYRDAWISINGTVYRITGFIDKHPFGDTFRGNLGAECGGLFSSSHVNTKVEQWIKNDAYLRYNDIIKIGQLDVSSDELCKSSPEPLLNRIVYRDTRNDKFWEDLTARVSAFLKESDETTHYTTREGASYLIYYLVIYLGLSYLTWVQGSFIAAVLLGIHMICALANIAHMATHYGFTRNQPLNFVAMHLFDLAGMSGLEWQITHQTHHNQPHSSIDYQTNVYGHIGIRIHEYIEHKHHHRYQKLYFWLSVSPYLLFKFVATSIWLWRNCALIRHPREVVIHVAARAILIAQVVYCAMTLGALTAAGLVLAYSVAFSQTAFILLFNDHEETHHLLGGKENVRHYHHKLSWAETQVRTSNNWYPTGWISAFFEFHYGYFNYHIEHHLFPSFKPSLLKKISHVVREVCEEHGIRYISTRFFEVQKSLYSHLTRLGLAGQHTKQT